MNILHFMVQGKVAVPTGVARAALAGAPTRPGRPGLRPRGAPALVPQRGAVTGRALFILLLAWLVPLTGAIPAARAATPAEDRLVQVGRELLRPLLEEQPRFGLTLTAAAEEAAGPLDFRADPASGAGPAGARLHRLTIQRLATDVWVLRLDSPWRDVFLARQPDQTTLLLPRAGVAFVGDGPLASDAPSLAAPGLLSRLVTPETSLSAFLAFLGPSLFETGLRRLVLPFLTPVPEDEANRPAWSWHLAGGARLLVPREGRAWLALQLPHGSRGLAGLSAFTLAALPEDAPTPPTPTGPFRTKRVPRADLERMLCRGLARALSVKFPGPPVLNRPEPARVPHGELRHHDGQILVRLAGTPTEIGTAHGRLLAREIRRTVDSTLHLVGLVATLEQGKWFPAELEEAWRRCAPHIPADHLAELQAIASACPDLTWDELRLSSIFPEYFHCSGFALFGRATADGTLYHGRVLDYMTEIGLQQVAVAFVVKPQGGHGFLNAGYAGLQGAVSGMNEAGLSLGEMGGGGRYQWDGTPMCTLMRRALAECGTLEEVKTLWASSPRTCEYFYVFADAKGPAAVAVRATPTDLEFLGPGQSHPLLGEGIADAVVLSAGGRLKELRHRIMAGHGTFTATAALRLMDRPVAMRSNLHNCLFVPARQEAWIANAGDGVPAAEMPYVRYDLRELLRDLPTGP